MEKEAERAGPDFCQNGARKQLAALCQRCVGQLLARVCSRLLPLPAIRHGGAINKTKAIKHQALSSCSRLLVYSSLADFFFPTRLPLFFLRFTHRVYTFPAHDSLEYQKRRLILLSREWKEVKRRKAFLFPTRL